MTDVLKEQIKRAISLYKCGKSEEEIKTTFSPLSDKDVAKIMKKAQIVLRKEEKEAKDSQRYHLLVRRAIVAESVEKGDNQTALKALDSLAKIEGLVIDKSEVKIDADIKTEDMDEAELLKKAKELGLDIPSSLKYNEEK